MRYAIYGHPNEAEPRMVVGENDLKTDQIAYAVHAAMQSGAPLADALAGFHVSHSLSLRNGTYCVEIPANAFSKSGGEA